MHFYRSPWGYVEFSDPLYRGIPMNWSQNFYHLWYCTTILHILRVGKWIVVDYHPSLLQAMPKPGATTRIWWGRGEASEAYTQQVRTIFKTSWQSEVGGEGDHIYGVDLICHHQLTVIGMINIFDYLIARLKMNEKEPWLIELDWNELKV